MHVPAHMHTRVHSLLGNWQQDLFPGAGTRRLSYPFLRNLSQSSSEPHDPSSPRWWWCKTRTCSPTTSEAITQAFHTRDRSDSSSGTLGYPEHSMGKDCPRETGTEIGFPLSLKGWNWHRAGKKEEKATMLMTAFIRAFFPWTRDQQIIETKQNKT